MKGLFDTDKAIQAFLVHCHSKTYRSKSMIIRQGDPTGELFYIIEGSVAVMLEDEKGHEIILAYLNKGEFFGEMGLFKEDMSRTALVRARQKCEIAQISYQKLRTMADIIPDLMFAMNMQLAMRLHSTNRKVGDLAFMDVFGRIARALLDLSREPDALTHPEGMQIRITRQELGRIVGCSREMVGRVLKEMEEQRHISTDGKDIVVFGTR